MTKGPDFSFETEWIKRGLHPVAGVDEAGRGPLAGPVVIASVILNPEQIPAGLDDSKKLSASKRESLFDAIVNTAHCSIVSVSANEIDRLNIRAATLDGMVKAVRALPVTPLSVLVDGRDWPKLDQAGEAIIKGDGRSLSVAAASILAKVTRDRLMQRAASFWPGYGFETHMGYGTKQHLEAIGRLGPCPIHRMSFAPLKHLPISNHDAK